LPFFATGIPATDEREPGDDRADGDEDGDDDYDGEFAAMIAPFSRGYPGLAPAADQPLTEPELGEVLRSLPPARIGLAALRTPGCAAAPYCRAPARPTQAALPQARTLATDDVPGMPDRASGVAHRFP